MDKLPKLYRSRKFFAVLSLICFLGLKSKADQGSDINPFIVLLFFGFCASFYSIWILTKHKKGTTPSE